MNCCKVIVRRQKLLIEVTLSNAEKNQWVKADPHSYTDSESKCCRKTDSSTQIHVILERHDSLRNNMLNCSRSLDHVNDGVPATVQCLLDSISSVAASFGCGVVSISYSCSETEQRHIAHVNCRRILGAFLRTKDDYSQFCDIELQRTSSP